MGEYDLKRLEVAIQYINRMVSGRNPVTNRPAPDNEVLINPNVNRCLQFVSEILTDVKSTGGIVGKVQKIPRAARAPKPSIAETFPYEILQGFRYQRDQQISYFLKQLAEQLPEEESLGVQATLITDWLREKPLSPLKKERRLGSTLREPASFRMNIIEFSITRKPRVS